MAKNFEKKKIIKKSENFSAWYQDVILEAELADYAPVKGCMVIRPYGYAIWENIQKIFDEMIKKIGVKNAYFPLFIPERFLKKEKEHVKGFSPVVAVVTIGGGEKLEEKLIVRPTSETIMYAMYAKWLRSWRDLPILINQWNNIVRWEKRTYLFLRTTEFLWQEGHTVHETHQESLKLVAGILDNYAHLYKKYFAIDGIAGKKSESEKFPGAEATFSYEMLMPDGKALQGCTSHDLGQNFAKVFNIRFLGRDGKQQIPWQTSWGLTTRSIGALIMVHGDDNGLVLPPYLSPIQIIIIPVLKNNQNDDLVIKEAKRIRGESKDFKVEIDLRGGHSLGWKINDWELRGVPLRIELGEKEVKEKIVTLVRRDNFEKIKIKKGNLRKEVKSVLDDVQKCLFEKSRKFIKENIHLVNDYTEFKKIMKSKRGFIKAFWCENEKCEAKIKEETKATTRCLPLDAREEKGNCIYCGKPAKRRWIFAQAY